ncbi:MAG: Trk system potassium transporter TrkA [Muribaculaceae bacterium]|nr:Trk system potassium transporter TrkA [Muribaculaceae bacterium]
MKILIAGAGEVGTHLAKLLTQEEMDITLMDEDPAKLDSIGANYNLMTWVGSALSFQTMKEAGAGRADLFISVLPTETDNVVACQIATELGARKTVARIDNYEFMAPGNREFFHRLGVKSLIYPEYLAAQEIVTALERTWVRHWFEIHDGQIILVGVKLRDNARMIGMQLKEFAMSQRNFHVSAIKRRHETIIPRGDDRILTGDILYFTATREHVDELIELCGKRSYTIRNVMVMGGSRIAIRLANLAGDRFRIKIIESNRNRCEQLAELCPKARIIHGDARDIETLRDEDIGDMDAFIALSDSSETNILSCLTAKEFGVSKTVAEVENIQFIAEAENLNIGTIVNKKLLSSSAIFQMLLDADSSTSKCLALTDAEVAEIEVKPGSKVTRGPVKDLKLSRDMTIAGLIRNGEGRLVTGNTVIEAGDHVVVFCLTGAINKVERLFG